MFTPKRSLCVIVCIFFFIMLTYVPIFYSHRLQWRQLPDLNVTKLILVLIENQAEIENSCRYTNDVILPTTCLILVMVCTKITVSRIYTNGQWRESVTAQVPTNVQVSTISTAQEQPHQQQQRDLKKDCYPSSNRDDLRTNGDASTVKSKHARYQKDKKELERSNGSGGAPISQKEKKITRMITLICIIFLMCNTPCIVVIYVRLIVPDIGNMERYHNLFHILYSTVFLLETFNSSINIVPYYTLSSRYKQEFKKINKYFFAGTRD